MTRSLYDEVKYNIKHKRLKDFKNAIINGDNDRVLAYLENGVSANMCFQGMSVMEYAFIHKNLVAIIVLSKFGAEIPRDEVEYINSKSVRLALESVI